VASEAAPAADGNARSQRLVVARARNAIRANDILRAVATLRAASVLSGVRRWRVQWRLKSTKKVHSPPTDDEIG